MERYIRWEQRFSNFIKALDKLQQAVEYIQENIIDDENLIEPEGLNYVMDEMLKEGLIQRFEYTHELAWKVMKDYAEYQGNFSVGGSRDATREAFELKLIENGTVWMEMINSRNKTSHTYNSAIADEIYVKILAEYYPEFIRFRKQLEDKISQQSNLLNS